MNLVLLLPIEALGGGGGGIGSRLGSCLTLGRGQCPLPPQAARSPR